MSMLDPDSDIAATTRRDRNASNALPQVVGLMSTFNIGSDKIAQVSAAMSYEIADAMEVARSNR